MKTKLAFVLLAVLAVVQTTTGKAPLSPEKSNYVVIGAFASPKNALDFTEHAKKQHFDATFSINPLRRLFYVYVLQTENRQAAIEQAKRLRKETSFYDTWVFSGLLGEELEQGSGKDINPLTQEKMDRIISKDGGNLISLDSAGANALEINASDSVLTKEGNASIDETVEGKRFVFSIMTKGSKIQGDIDVKDLDRPRLQKAASYRGNEEVIVRSINKSGNISLECEVFGYRKVKQSINYNQVQVVDGISVDNDVTTVPFELVRLKKGDIAVMYNVYFFKDAAVMRPESRYEVMSLLEMLKENPRYKIKIHGHTNGNGQGKIISMGSSKNFFSLNETKDGFGSAKKLSEERAKVIQAYLAAEGIDAQRMQIKAWGGKKPIYKKDHALAHSNVRVEIEIVED